MKKVVLIILCLSVLSVFSSCFSENGAEQSNEKNKIGITDSITSSTVATTDKTEQNTANSNIKNNKKQQKILAKAYEDYYFDKSNDIAIKANSFSILKSEVDFKKVFYKTYGLSEKEAKSRAIDDLIKREVVYILALQEKITVTDKELKEYIEQQKSLAKETDSSYLSYLNKININNVYTHELQNIQKSLYIDKYYQWIEEKYGEEKCETMLNNAIHTEREKENIKILL